MTLPRLGSSDFVRSEQGELRDVEFTATLQQLQDMLTRLKEASSAVEGMVGGFDEPAGSSGRGGRGGAGGGSRKK